MAFGAEFELKSGAVIRVDTGRLELVNPAPYLKVSRYLGKSSQLLEHFSMV